MEEHQGSSVQQVVPVPPAPPASRVSSRNVKGGVQQGGGGQLSAVHSNQGQDLSKESPAAAMLRLSPDRWILQPSNYGNGAMHVTVPPTARRGRGDSAGATRSGDGMPLMLPPGMVGEGGVSMDSHLNDNTKSCRVYSFPAQLLDIIEDEDSLDADAPPPPHAALVNYPTGSASERRARVNPANANRKKGGKGGNPNQQHCVMCGRGTESDNVVIPVQNKQVCTDCDTGVWLYKADNTYFKWCKGCKRFRSIHAFREKLQGLRGATRTTCLPSKCDSCRCRGRLGYRAKKEAGTPFKSEDGMNGEGPHGTRGGRSASMDALLLTGLANSASSDPTNPGEGEDGDEDCGEGPNKKQKRAIKTMKSAKDIKSAANRGRKGKNGMGMHLPLGLSLPMGMSSDLSMGMQMNGMPLSMMSGGLPLSFHHAMYLQQQQAAAGGGSSSEGGNDAARPGNGAMPGLLYNSPFSQQLVECLMKMPMYSGTGASGSGIPPPLHSAESSAAAGNQSKKEAQPAANSKESVGV